MFIFFIIIYFSNVIKSILSFLIYNCTRECTKTFIHIKLLNVHVYVQISAQFKWFNSNLQATPTKWARYVYLVCMCVCVRVFVYLRIINLSILFCVFLYTYVRMYVYIQYMWRVRENTNRELRVQTGSLYFISVIK